MKKLLLGFTAVFALLFLTNCTSMMSSKKDVKKEWMLVEFQNFSKEMMTKNKAMLDLTGKAAPSKFTANMGCNNMFGNSTFSSNGTVKFSEVGMTMMYCDKGMDLETAFGKALPMMTKYSIDGHFLTLSDSDGNKMKFVAADWD